MQTEKPVRITVPLPAAAAVALCAAPLPIAPESSGTAVILSMTMVFFALLSL